MSTSSPPPLVLPAWNGAKVIVSDRAGGLSVAPFHSLNLGDHVGDDPQAVAANRGLLELGLPGSPLWLRQVHGTRVFDADAAAGTVTPPEADAAITCRADQVLAILSADCLPVIMTDSTTSVLAVAHAGWRGLAAGVLEATVEAMRQRIEGSDVELMAWIGPGIGPEAFEVGADVVAAFGSSAPQAAFVPRAESPGKWLCDLPMLAEARLRAAGFASVQRSGVCTYSDKRYFSFRRDGLTGRFATLAWLVGKPQGGIGESAGVWSS